MSGSYKCWKGLKDADVANLPKDKVVVLTEQARRLLTSSQKQGYDPHYKHHYKYVCPSPQKYPWQWFWDSCFHAITLSHLDVDLAKNELYNLVLSQDPDGFIGHVVFWRGAAKTLQWHHYYRWVQSKLTLRPHHSALIQPPVLAQAVRKVYDVSQDTAYLREMFPHLARYYRWLATHRDPDNDGLIAIISNYESGLDHLPVYDRILGFKKPPKPWRPSRWQLEVKGRGLDLSNLILGQNFNLTRIFALDRFNVEDVMVNCIYAEALYDLAEMAQRLDATAEAREFSQLAQRVEAAILTKCYDSNTKAFYTLYQRSEHRSPVLSCTSLFPLILPNIPRQHLEELVRLHVQNQEEFWLPFPVPSVPKSEPTFDPKPGYSKFPALWRGPTWMNVNWFLTRGLRKHGYSEIADVIVEKSAELVLKDGFREFYHPITGQGLGATNFGWSTLVVDMVE